MASVPALYRVKHGTIFRDNCRLVYPFLASGSQDTRYVTPTWTNSWIEKKGEVSLEMPLKQHECSGECSRDEEGKTKKERQGRPSHIHIHTQTIQNHRVQCKCDSRSMALVTSHHYRSQHIPMKNIEECPLETEFFFQLYLFFPQVFIHLEIHLIAMPPYATTALREALLLAYICNWFLIFFLFLWFHHALIFQ